MNKYIPVFAVAMLAGCQSVGEVVQIGNDTYMVDATTRGGFQSHGETTALAVRKAQEFCAAQGKEIQAGPIKTSGARGWTPLDSSVTFQCLAKDDPDYRRVPLDEQSNPKK